ncbi:hypothetical protein ACH5RR_024321 [Cinchona calisaya]|uniref:Exocyst subunit Exo70 family protein n=1 Tax=Cinchona calisaya TaxID=153742 RepID=A0ABD2YWA8_9GENT
MEASNSPSAFRNFPNPTEPIYPKIHLGFTYEDQKSPETNGADDAMEIAIDRLKNDFQGILHLQVEGVATQLTDPSSTTGSSFSFSLLSVTDENSTGNYRGPTKKDVSDLRSIALKMNEKGRLDKLINVYVRERKCFFNAHFLKLWDEKKSRLCEIQRLERSVLEAKITRWIRAVHYCVRDIFPLEKQLSNHVFKSLGSNATGESCFIAVVRDSVTDLLDFADALSSCRPSPERLPKILVLYRKLSSLSPDINSVFESDAARAICARADCILSRLGGKFVRLSLLDFENTLLRELCNYTIPGGAIHSSTEYVIGYVISLVSESKETLTELITFKPSMSVGDLIISDLDVKELEGRTPLAAHLLWIIIVLRLNLERKSKCYQDPLLGNLFMLNNVNYIVQQIRGSAVLTEIIGDKYLNKLAENVQESMTSYISGAWDAPVYCLRHEGLNVIWGFTIGSKLSKKVLKDRFKTFNSLFKEIHEIQMMWEVPDLELRKKLHRCILDYLIPPYRDFLGKFRSHIDRGQHPERYVMYSAEELENKVSGLFSYRSFL